MQMGAFEVFPLENASFPLVVFTNKSCSETTYAQLEKETWEMQELGWKSKMEEKKSRKQEIAKSDIPNNIVLDKTVLLEESSKYYLLAVSLTRVRTAFLLSRYNLRLFVPRHAHDSNVNSHRSAFILPCILTTVVT